MSQGSLTSFTSDRFGYLNSALSLNGGFTQVPLGYYFNSPQFSVTLWVYPSQVGTWARIFDFANSGSSTIEEIFWSFSTYSLRFPSFRISVKNTSLIADTQSNISLEQNKWHFLTATFDGFLLSLYVNGTLAASSIVSGQIPKVQRANNFFGNSNYLSDGVSSSYLDDIRFYNISLTQTQIIDLMNDVSNSFIACPFILTTTIAATTTTSTSTTSTTTTSITESSTSIIPATATTISTTITLTTETTASSLTTSFSSIISSPTISFINLSSFFTNANTNLFQTNKSSQKVIS